MIVGFFTKIWREKIWNIESRKYNPCHLTFSLISIYKYLAAAVELKNFQQQIYLE